MLHFLIIRVWDEVLYSETLYLCIMFAIDVYFPQSSMTFKAYLYQQTLQVRKEMLSRLVYYNRETRYHQRDIFKLYHASPEFKIRGSNVACGNV